jgi:plastocyanin
MARQRALCRVTLAWLLLVLAPPVLAVPATTHTVTIQGFQYMPSPLMIHSGDTVRWLNRDLVPHTVTSTTGQFDSGEIPPNASWSFRAMQKGRFSYICQYHPDMAGVLVVR